MIPYESHHAAVDLNGEHGPLAKLLAGNIAGAWTMASELENPSLAEDALSAAVTRVTQPLVATPESQEQAAYVPRESYPDFIAFLSALLLAQADITITLVALAKRCGVEEYEGMPLLDVAIRAVSRRHRFPGS